MSDYRVIAKNLSFPEGPVAMKDGSVIFTEIRSGLVRRAWPDGRVTTVADCGGGPNGAAIGPDGALYVCNNGGNTYPADHFVAIGPAADYAGGSIQRVDLATGQVTTLYSHCGQNRLSSPNDIVFDKLGGFYFSDMGKKRKRDRDHGGLYYATIDGREITEIAYQVQAANGVGLSPDGRVLYAAETETARLWAFDIASPGKLDKHPFPSMNGGRMVVGLPGFLRLDSMAMEANGNVCVATLMTGEITVVSPQGEVVRRVKLPEIYGTNICFGGPGLRTAYITLAETGQLIAMDWPEAGLPLEFNA